MSELVYIQSHIFDIDCKRVYPILGHKEAFAVADEVTFSSGNHIEELKHLKKLVNLRQVFLTSDLASAVSLCKEQAKLWALISSLEDGNGS